MDAYKCRAVLLLVCGASQACTFGDRTSSSGSSSHGSRDSKPASDDASTDDESDEPTTADEEPTGEDPDRLDQLAEENPGRFEDICESAWDTWKEQDCPIAEQAASDCPLLPEACQIPYLRFVQCTFDTLDCFGRDCESELNDATNCLDENPQEPSSEDGPEPEPEPDPEPQPEPEPEFAPAASLDFALRRYTQIACSRDASCLGLLMNLYSGDEAYCLDHLQRLVEGEARLPDTGYTMEAVDDCARAISELDCEQWAEYSAGLLAPCNLVGSRAPGDACASGAQCESGWCESQPYSCGVCANLPVAGDRCTEYWECPPSMTCREETCTPLPATGQACDEQSPCLLHADTCVDGVCVRRDRQLGQSCGPDEGQPFCAVTGETFLACDSSSQQCIAVDVAHPGQPCPDSGWCGARSTCQEGVCVAAPEEGDSCESAGYCRWPAVCVESECRGPDTPLGCDSGNSEESSP